MGWGWSGVAWWNYRTPFWDSMREESEWNEIVSEIEAEIARQRQ